MLADSEYRHELEADIEPFKGLLLGLFFIAVGMSTDLRLMVQQPLIIIGLAVGLMTIKSCVLYVIARMTRHQHNAAINLALHISQGGEFAFVLFGVAVGAHVLDKALADKLIVVVTLSMVLTPLISIANDKWFKLGQKKGEVRPYDEIENRESRVIIAGLGRFGQMIGRILLLKKIPITVLDSSFLQVETAAKFGYQAYFGDASRLDLLRAARADQAEVFVLAIDDVEASVKAAEMVRKHYPHLKIYARARDRVHAYRLMDVGVDKLIRETFLSSLDLARDVLVELGHTQAKAEAAVRMFRKHDDELLVSQHRIHQDEAKIIASSKQGMDELQRLFEQDAGR